MSPDEQRIIHEAASSAAESIIAAAEAMGSLASSLKDEQQATLALFAIEQLKASQEGMYRLFVELNKEKPENASATIHARN